MPEHESLPKPEEVELKIQLYKELLEQINTFLNEKISSLEEAKLAIVKASEAGALYFELPKPVQGQERLYGWLETKLKEQQDKGHIQNLKLPSQEKKPFTASNSSKKMMKKPSVYGSIG
jgi:hypothetical protein